MIFTDRTIIVKKGTSSIDDTIVLYRGDKEVEIRFTLNEGSPFRFGSGASPNIIEKTEAAYGQLVIKAPNDLPSIFSEIAPTNGGKIVFTITAEMIDEITEVGNYTFQIRLLDESRNSRATLPEVVNGIEIREPIASEDTTNEVGAATVGYALTTAGTTENAFDSQGNYNKTTWVSGDRITDTKLNKMETGIDEVNKKVADNSSQIKDIENGLDESGTYINTNSKNTKCCITFLDDDGHVDVYNRLLPIFKSKNAKFAACLITDLIDTDPGCMSLNQVKECVKNGMETLSHTKNVSTNLTDNYSDSAIIEQLKVSKDWLKNNGFMYEGFVYPQSGYNLKIRKFVKEYYKYAFGDMGFNDLGYLDHSRIKRIAFGSWTTNNPTVNGNSEKNTLAYYKECVDYANSKNIWLIFMSHVGQQTSEQDEILKQLLDYIESLNIDIVTPSEGFNLKRNQVNIGDLDETYLFIGEDLATNITGYKFKKSTGYNKDTSIAAYDKNCKTLQFFLNSDKGGFPDGAGSLETYRSKEWDGLSYQIFRPFVNYKTYKRVWNPATSAWGNWIWMEDQNSIIITLPYNSVTANTPSSEFENNKISYCQITTSRADSFPTKIGGVLETNKIIKDNGYSYQKYRVYNSNIIYERKILSDGTYSAWVINSPNIVTIKVPEILVNANSFASHEITCENVTARSTGITGNPMWGLTEGILYNVYVKTNGKICISYYNTTTTSITLAERDWKFFINN